VLPPYMGDPQPIATPQLALAAGSYQYSVWVTDDDNMTSEPATLAFTIGAP